MKVFSIFVLQFALFTHICLAGEPSALDLELKKYVAEFNLKPLNYPEAKPRDLVMLGARLFFEKKLSGNQNISCATCHAPIFASADGLPLGIGQGASGFDETRAQNGAPLLPRHSPHLINLGQSDQLTMFWDGRVSFDPKSKTFTTPEASLNGARPLLQKVTAVMTHASSAQALFPMLSPEEMLGESGDNEIASLSDPALIWQALLERLIYGAQASAYQSLFLRAFPKVSSIGELNIGHVGEALAAFERHGFVAIDTPWDRYLRGDLAALSESEKRGALIFNEKARCVQCHNGPHLSNFEFRNIATPPIGPGNDSEGQDFGRSLVSGTEADRYRFKVPPLRAVALTAPYMHNGAFSTLEEVVDHYNHVRHSFMHYETTLVMSRYGKVYDQEITRVFVRDRVIEMFNNLDENVWPPLFLSEEERSDLLNFLKVSLTPERLEYYRPWAANISWVMNN